MLPDDSDTVQIDTTGLTEADLKRLRKRPVVDLRTLAGRPLTEAEAQQLTARMNGNSASARQALRLYLPPEEYFTTRRRQQDLVCLAANGDLVAVNDPALPAGNPQGPAQERAELASH